MSDPDDDLLDALADLARSDAAPDHPDRRWEALADGASPNEEAALRARAARDPDAARRLEIFAPLGEASRARFVDGILSTLAADAPSPSGDASGDAARAADADTAPAPDNVVPFVRRRAALIIGGLVAAAAAVLIATTLTPDPQSYALSPEIGGLGPPVRTVADRGPGAQPERLPYFAPSTPIRLRLRAGSPGDRAAVRAAVRADGVTRPWPIEFHVSAEGHLTAQGSVEALGLWRFGPGRRTIVLAVGPPDALPEQIDHPAPPGADWQSFAVDVELVSASEAQRRAADSADSAESR